MTETLRIEVRDGLELAYWRAGAGGVPLLLVHGWPETKRIWTRNLEPLAAAGFDVVAPDLRGFGESGLPPDGFSDLAAHARDLAALLDALGLDTAYAAGGDLGGGVIIDLGLRFAGRVRRQVIFNSILPLLAEAKLPPVARQAADYYVRQGREADALAAELSTPELRRRYIAGFYGHRFWATPGAFARDDVDYMTEPFADGERLRASFGNYESAFSADKRSELPRFFEPSPVPTLALYGPDDHVIGPDFPDRCEASFADLTGPYVVPRAGHFLQWERAELLNRTIAAFCRE
jgi:pimeloyl-ACP methyl ester carboxylesterase